MTEETERDVFDEAIEEVEKREEEERKKIERQNCILEQETKGITIKLRFPEMTDKYKGVAEGEISLKFLPFEENKSEKDQWQVKCEISYEKDPDIKFDTFEEAEAYFKSILIKHKKEITTARNDRLDNEITEKKESRNDYQRWAVEETIKQQGILKGLKITYGASFLMILALFIFKEIWLKSIFLIGVVIVLDLIISVLAYYAKNGIKNRGELEKRYLNSAEKEDKEVKDLQKQKEYPLI